jgi:hypothetical protein
MVERKNAPIIVKRKKDVLIDDSTTNGALLSEVFLVTD